DLDSFLTTGQQLPGKYRVELFVNQRLIDTREIDFIYKKNKLHPQLTVEQLSNLGVKVDAFPGLSEKGGKGIITDLSEYIPEAYTKFDFNEQKLYLSVPQAALKSTARGYVDPEKWDQGIPALFVNYSYTSSHTYERSKTSNDYLNLQSGLNLGAWRLRNYSTFTHNKDSKHRWDNIQSYLFRDIHSLKSQLVIGDSYTAGEIFDSLKVRGISISSDNSMLPESLRGFAPVVRGIANSNAQVTIRQGGYIIYQTYVPPGAFTIDDLYPTNISGDLEVIIREANGTERRTVQPYSSVPIMVREGQVRYSVTGGKYLSSSFEKNDSKYSQATLSYGLPNAATMYSGFQVSEKYHSLLLGLGYGLGELGSLSFDLTQAKTNAEEKRYQGQSYRLKYAKNIISSGTALTLASYRYSTIGFFDFSEAHSLNSLGAFP
ncbi:fimbrial assembly protein, partial [Enterobacter cloacae]